MSRVSRSLLLPGWIAASCLVLPAARAGEVDDASRTSRIEFTPTDVNQPVSIDLRTTMPNAQALILLSLSVQPFNPDGPGGVPWLRTYGVNTGLLIVPTDAAGRFFATGTTPNDPNLIGMTGFVQALTVTPDLRLDVTNVAAITVGTGPTASFVDRTALLPPATAAPTNTVAAQDLDLDGDPDLVLASDNGPVVLRNDGNFVFTDVTATAIPAAAQFESAIVELFDANGDRWIDVFIGGGLGDASNPPLSNVLLRNQGGLTFAVDANFPSTAGAPSEVWAFDLDRDADLDLVIANGSDAVHGGQEAPGINVLLVNQGGAQHGIRGHFVEDAAFSAAAWNGAGLVNKSVAGGDIDNDGDVDLFIGRSDQSGSDGTPGQPNVLLRNDGAAGFTDVSATHLQPLYSDNTFGGRFADFDGDGLLDLLVANSVTSILSAQSGIYYRNQGGGVMVEDKVAFPQIDDSELSIRLGVRPVDIDLDGDLDVLAFHHEFLDFDHSTGSNTGGDDLLFVNMGGIQGGVHGSFQLATYTSGGVFISSDMVLADFDVDGDDDVYVSSIGSFFGVPGLEADHLFENLRIP